MKLSDIIKIGVALFAIALIAVVVHSCKDAWHASPVTQTVGTKSTIEIKSGTPDTNIVKHPVHGKTNLQLINNSVVHDGDTTTKTQSSWAGTLNIGKDSLSVTATIDTAGTLNLEYAGSVIETVISKTDSIFSNTVNTVVEKTPWYETPIAVITGTVVVLIGITAIIFKVL
jgi:hypothetical protein